MHVYQLTKHEKYEGHEDIGLYASESGARAAAQAHATQYGAVLREPSETDPDDNEAMSRADLTWVVENDQDLTDLVPERTTRFWSTAPFRWSDIYGDWASWYIVEKVEVQP